jgi:hypothetical protein
MTFDRDRHVDFEELISAAISGDITLDEQHRLDAHLAGCAACRATADAFAAQRQIMSGLRHVAPPRDLGARVRTLVELEQRRAVPWWRRPAAIFAGVGGGLAVVAGALLAIVLLDSPTPPDVGQLSPTPVPSVSVAPPSVQPSSAPSGAPVVPTLPPAQTPAPSGTVATPVPSTGPEPTPPPNEPAPDPDGYVAVAGPLESPTMSVIDGTTDEEVAVIAEPSETDAVGVPTSAELSPGGQWLAYIASLGESGMNEVRVTRIGDALDPADGDAITPVESDVEVGSSFAIGRSVAGSPFVDRMSWSPDGHWLAVTIADPDTLEVDSDVWIFDVTDGASHRLTDTGNGFAGSFVPATEDDADGAARLWVSLAGDEPQSHLVELANDAEIAVVDPAQDPIASVRAFQPLVSPNGAFVIAWTGRMAVLGDHWALSEGGQPILAAHAPGSDEPFAQARSLFGDLVVDRDAFTWASIAWSPDGVAYALWNARWTGASQGSQGQYPDATRVYFGHATDPRGLTEVHAIDIGDVPDDARVVDVKVAPTGRHLVITAGRPTPGDLTPRSADLLLITRNTGRVADEVEELASGDDGWFGPAIFDDASWNDLLAE